MIPETELRIGNWVDVRNSSHSTFGKEPRFTVVESIGRQGINIESSYEGSIEANFDEQSLFGIPLAHEILTRCGFVYSEIRPAQTHWFIKIPKKGRLIIY